MAGRCSCGDVANRIRPGPARPDHIRPGPAQPGPAGPLGRRRRTGGGGEGRWWEEGLEGKRGEVGGGKGGGGGGVTLPPRPQSRVHRLRRRGRQQLRRRDAAKRGSVPCLRLRGGLLGRRLTLTRLARRLLNTVPPLASLWRCNRSRSGITPPVRRLIRTVRLLASLRRCCCRSSSARQPGRGACRSCLSCHLTVHCVSC